MQQVRRAGETYARLQCQELILKPVIREFTHCSQEEVSKYCMHSAVMDANVNNYYPFGSTLYNV